MSRVVVFNDGGRVCVRPITQHDIDNAESEDSLARKWSSGGEYIVIDESDLPVRDENRDYWEMQSGTIVINVPGPDTETLRKQSMMTGVEFEGIMCSAFKDDQFGLSSIKPYITQGMDFDFEFVNGNVLNINPANVQAFESVWFPFRLAHTKVNFQP